jgi:hypothetical protein
MTTATMAAPAADTLVSDSKLIAGFFFGKGMTAKQKMVELKALTPLDRAHLGSGIRSGSLTYED